MFELILKTILCCIVKTKRETFEYHKSLKQNVGVAKSPTRTVNTQTNHLFCSILAYVKLEKFKLKTKLNHFELKLRCISKL